MTQDEIIRMAREAGCWETDTGELITEDISLKRFAALVAAHERDACAKVCDELKWHSAPLNFAENCAAAIRAR